MVYKFIILGTSEGTIRCTQALLEADAEVQAIISMPENCRPDNSADVGGFARGNKIQYHELRDINTAESMWLIHDYAPDYILSSWPQVLSNDVLALAKYYCIGSHPTDLPFNRGRHPLHWLISQGIIQSRFTLFRMNQGIDTGNILVQVPFRIAPTDSIPAVVTKANEAAYKGVGYLCKEIECDPYVSGVMQDQSKANYWRKRTAHDVTLDLRMSADAIIRLVRSFAPPYPCARLLFENYLIKIVEAVLVFTELNLQELQRIEPGRIIHADSRHITVKVDDRLLELITKDDLPDSLLHAMYIHPPTKYLQPRRDLNSNLKKDIKRST